MSKLSKELSYLLSPTAVRERCKKIYLHALDGKTHFSINESKIPATVEFVLNVIYENYPNLDIPFHSRWGHFNVGGILRGQEFYNAIESHEKYEQARRKIDLVITSVLLDAGAGPQWRFFEDGKHYSRSEGLAVASYHMFRDGRFSKDQNDHLRADAEAMKNLTEQDLIASFQVQDNNPLVGTSGRTQLINKLGEGLSSKKKFFKDGRPGNLVDYLLDKHGEAFTGADVLQAVLLGFGEIWPGRINFEGQNLGDVWSHHLLGDTNKYESLVAFHKLSQWLTYSLIEPLMEADLKVSGVELLTGLAEYRNGGLFIDKEVINLREQDLIKEKHKPSSELVVEWRALTVTLLDIIGEKIQQSLKKSPEEFPLAKVLEGGTWWAGRKIAATLREDMSTPIKLDSDGTVF